MKYRSTRDCQSLPTRCSFEEAVMLGLAPDGGLFVPDCLPDSSFYASLVEKFKSSQPSFQELCMEIFGLFIDSSEISRQQLEQLVNKSFRTFRHDEITPVRPLGPEELNLYILELFHGPTFAFKDVALQFLGNLFDFFLERKQKSSDINEELVILGATSGDTGSAAIESVRSKKMIRAFILHPLDRISPIQKAQMCSILDDNIYNIAVKGTFDDCQRIVKEIFADAQWKSDNHVQLGAVNSINWARILAQIVYFFFAYFSIMKGENRGNPVRFSVPTGNFGDILAGYYARCLGLPVDDLIIATNKNDILHRFFSDGVYERNEVHQTLSPAMDIQISSNFERWLWDLMRNHYLSLPNKSNDEASELASKCITAWMRDLKETGKFILCLPEYSNNQVDLNLLEKAKLQFSSCRADDEAIVATIKKFSQLDDSKIEILDPHTAVGVFAAENVSHRTANTSSLKTICLSTAHPIKFVGAVLDAVKGTNSSVEQKLAMEKHILDGTMKLDGLELPEQFRGLLDKKQKSVIIENSPTILKQFIIDNLV